MWNEAVVAQFETPARKLPVRTTENHVENQGSRKPTKFRTKQFLRHQLYCLCHNFQLQTINGPNYNRTGNAAQRVMCSVLRFHMPIQIS